MRLLLNGLCVAAVLFCAPPAKAAWIKAETDRFVVYGDAREDVVRDYAAKLSAFDQVLRRYAPKIGSEQPKKFQLYVVRDRLELQEIQPGIGDGVVGFYRATRGAVFAVAAAAVSGVSRDEVLFHEYAHHFMLDYFPAPYPTWFVEGWAEFFATTKISGEGFQVGGYDPNRTYWLFHENWLPMSDVLTKSPGETRNFVLFYAQAWLLTHYMEDDPQRAAQLNKATAAIARGSDPVKAMEEATGISINELTSRLKHYERVQLSIFKSPPGPPASVTVNAMPASAEDFLLARLRLANADPSKPDTRFLGRIRKAAARYPDDGLAQVTLASAEYAYGDVAAAEAVIKRRLDAHPDDVEALAAAGVGEMVAGQRFADRRAAYYRAARAYLAKAYALDKDDYRTLLAYATCRSVEPGYPNDNDITALLEARALAPEVHETSLLAGAALMSRGRVPEATSLLTIVANDPHDVRLAKQAKAVMAGRTLEQAIAETAKEGDRRGAKPPQPAAPPKDSPPAAS